MKPSRCKTSLDKIALGQPLERDRDGRKAYMLGIARNLCHM